MTEPSQTFICILLAGTLGMIGQGARVVVGLKKMNDTAAQQNASSADLFIAARLLVSLMIGFIAGVIAGFGLGFANFTGSSIAAQTLIGVMAAGYAGTDVIEAFLPTIGGKPSAAPSPRLVKPLAAPVPAAAAPAVDATFCSLVPGGYFSANPGDLTVRRSIRTNNPGALNFSGWQKSRKGYVGVTQPDEAHNITTIYRSPEHGVAAWYHLLAVIYAFPAGVFTLQDLAIRYAGGAGNPAAVQTYVNGWNRWLQPPLPATAQIAVTSQDAMLLLGKAMFSHEAGMPTPIHDDQIAYAISQEITGTLPA